MALELEHERGKLTGLGQSNAALREHNSILETALAKREADLVQLNLQVLKLIYQKQEETCYRLGSTLNVSLYCLYFIVTVTCKEVLHPHLRAVETEAQRVWGSPKPHLPALRWAVELGRF